MSQHDMVVDNNTGRNVRLDINDALAALVSSNSGPDEPDTMFPFMLWADTTDGELKIRNTANNGWITIGELDVANLGLLTSGGGPVGAISIPAGLLATPSLSFASDADTGLYSPGANLAALVAGGVETLRATSAGTSFPKPFGGALANDAATGTGATLSAVATSIVRLTSGTLVSVSMIPAGFAGQFLVLMNTTGNSIQIADETGGTAADRIRTGSGGTFSFQNNAAVFMIYDSTSSRWRMIGGAGGTRASVTFTGTAITPAPGSLDQTHLYTGASAQTFTGVGTLASLPNGTLFRIMGSDDTNTLSISENDATDGWLMIGGPIELVKGRSIDFEYNSTLARLVETGRSF